MPDNKQDVKQQDKQEPENAMVGDNPGGVEEVAVMPVTDKGKLAELKRLEAQRLALKKQTPEQAKDRDPEEYGRIKGQIVRLKAELGIS